MMRRVLVVGFACLAAMAVAQSSGSGDKSAQAKPAEATRETASGLATGKRMHKPMTVSAATDLDGASKDAAKSETTVGTKSAADDWSANTKTKKDSGSSGQTSTHVAAGDVNGDGKAELTPAKNSGHATEHSLVASPRDMASGQASGKRQQAVSPSGQDSSGSSDSSSSNKDKK